MSHNETIPHLLAQAIQAHEAQREDEAKSLCDQALAIDPHNVDALQCAGAIAVAQKRLDDGTSLLERAVEQAPGNALILTNLGVALAEQRRWAEAEEVYRRAIAAGKADAAGHSNLANALLNQRKYEEAAVAYRESLRQNPHQAAAQLRLGIALRELGRKNAATDCFQQVVIIAPNSVLGHYNLGHTLMETGRAHEALPHCQRAVALKPEAAWTHSSLASTLAELNRIEEASASFERATTLDPDLLDAWMARGAFHQRLGALDDAEKCFRRALDDPKHAPLAFRALTVMNRIDRDGTEVRQMHQLLETSELDDSQRSQLHFALGAIDDRQGDTDSAFHHFQRANDLWPKTEPYDDRAYGEFVDALVDVFDKDFIQQAGQQMGSESELPVFIVGMPRSGTTLVEQIISSHPAVHGADELPHFFLFRQEIQKLCGVEYPHGIRSLATAAGRQLADTYLTQLGDLAPDAQRVTDKMPSNFEQIGLILTLFPRARIIHCRRDPRDVGLSCYFTCFLQANQFACSLRDIGRLHRHYERLMEH